VQGPDAQPDIVPGMVCRDMQIRFRDAALEQALEEAEAADSAAADAVGEICFMPRVCRGGSASADIPRPIHTRRRTGLIRKRRNSRSGIRLRY
jgi:hypothetical protein